MPAPVIALFPTRHLRQISYLASAKIIVGIANRAIVIAADFCAPACGIDTRLHAEHQGV
jgi:hypothetical protein